MGPVILLTDNITSKIAIETYEDHKRVGFLVPKGLSMNFGFFETMNKTKSIQWNLFLKQLADFPRWLQIFLLLL